MAKKLDQLIVIDVESSCWEGSTPKGQISDIIDIGICIIDIDSGQRLEKVSILVKPEHSSLSEFCSKFTHLTQEQVNKGISFKEACSLLKIKYLTKKRTWASYGDYDRLQFDKQCKLYNVEYPFSSTHINIKNLFAIKKKLHQEVGMLKALEILNLPHEGLHHKAIDDAWNIGNILLEILW